jgi:hypothetical protein
VPAPFWDADGGGYDELVSTFDRNPWDQLYLGGMLMPGIASLEDGQVARKIDIKNAKGQDGATITPGGYEPAKATFKLTLGGPVAWSLFQQVLPLLAPKFGKQSSPPMLCEHPGLPAYGIDKVIVEKVSLPKKGSVPGSQEVTLLLVQWVPQPKKTGKMATKAKGGDLPPTTKDAAESRAPYAPGKLPIRQGDFIYAEPEKTEARKPSEYNAVPNPT